MRLTPTERDRLLLFGAAELARARRARGLRLNVPEATALIADTVCEAARDGVRLAEAVAAARKALGPDDVLPGVPDVVTEIHVEAVFDDGTRLAVVSDPFGGGSLGAQAPGAVLPAAEAPAGQPAPVRAVTVRNTASVPISVTSHFHFFEANPAWTSTGPPPSGCVWPCRPERPRGSRRALGARSGSSPSAATAS